MDIQVKKYVNDFINSNMGAIASQMEKTGEFSKCLIKKLGESKLLASTLPVEYGGLGYDPIQYGTLIEEISKSCSATRTLLTVHGSLVAESILRFGSDLQKENWLPKIASGLKVGAFALTEPETGTDARSIKTEYTKKGDYYVINGKKRLISFAGIADFFIIISQNQGKISAFIVDSKSEGLLVTPMTGLLAGRATHLAEIELNNVLVPNSCLLGVEGGGYHFIVSTALDHGRYSVAWAGVGLAQASLEAMLKYVKHREQFGRKIYEFQLIKGIIGDSVTQIHAARAMCLRAGQLRLSRSAHSVIETSLAKYFTSKVAMKVASDAVQMHGGNGISNEFPVELYFREAKVLEIIEGTSQIQQQVAADFAINHYHEM